MLESILHNKMSFGYAIHLLLFLWAMFSITQNRKEGEMSAKDALDEKYRIGAKAICATSLNPAHVLPPKLKDLLIRSERLYIRIERLDSAMFNEEEEAPIQNPVNDQLQKLQAAFGGFMQSDGD